MTDADPDPLDPTTQQDEAGRSGAPAAPARDRPTRVSAAWIATGVGLLLLVLLFVFILQNQQRAQIHFLGWSGSMPVGVALFGASIAGGAVVAVAGISRIVQLRRTRRRDG